MVDVAARLERLRSLVTNLRSEADLLEEVAAELSDRRDTSATMADILARNLHLLPPQDQPGASSALDACTVQDTAPGVDVVVTPVLSAAPDA